MRSRLGECLVRAGLINGDQLRPAVEEHERTGERLGAVLVRMRVATEAQIADALATQLGFRAVDLTDTPPDPTAVRLIDRDLAQRAACIAIALDRNVLTVAMADPLAFSLVPDLEAQTGYRIQEVIATRSAILAAIEAGYQSTPAAVEGASHAPASGEADESDPELESLLQSIVDRAIEREATDIHLEPLEERAVVRYRVDGRLTEELTLARSAHEELLARFKLLASLDVAEKLLPQAGRLRLSGVHFRATTLRTIHGERLVLRPLVRRHAPLDLDTLGLPESAVEALRSWLSRDRGLIVVAGPVGSGRSTTLQAALAWVTRSARPGASAAAISDPVEIEQAGVTQAYVDASIGLSPTAALQAALAQAPDVVLVDEIADADVAALAARAASSGVLVIAGIQAADAAAGALAMSALAGSALAPPDFTGVLAQRLLRRLCDVCRRQRKPSAEDLELLGVHEIVADEVRVFDPAGCDRCDYTGFRGRFALFEALPITDRVRQLIAAGASRDALRESAQTAGLVSLAAQGAEAVRSGLTTVAELRRWTADGAGFAPKRGIIRLVRNPDPPGTV